MANAIPGAANTHTETSTNPAPASAAPPPTATDPLETAFTDDGEPEEE